MGYPNHIKETSKGPRYRVWSTITDTYISETMTEDELREFELVRQTERAVEQIWGNMDRDIKRATRVEKWWRNRQRFRAMSEEEYEKMLEHLASRIGARINVDLENKADGSKVLTIEIKPVKKSNR